MDGRIRRLSAIASMFVVAACGACFPVVADDEAKRTPNESPLYVSPELESEFLGAVLVDLRIDDSATATRRGGELELRSKNNEKFPKFKSRVITISLERRPARVGSHADGTTTPSDTTYVVSGLPSELVKVNQTLTLKLTSAKDDEDTVQLMLSDGDRKPCGSVTLTRVKLPEESVELKSAKRGSTD